MCVSTYFTCLVLLINITLSDIPQHHYANVKIQAVPKLKSREQGVG